MLISELAKVTGVSPKTIRYYESLGLLKPTRRTRGNYRVYDESAVPMLQFIRHAKRLGFSLKDIRQVLRVWRRKGVTCDLVRQIAQQKLERVDALLRELMALRERLQRLIEALTDPHNCGPKHPWICRYVMEVPPLDNRLTYLLANWMPKSHRRRHQRRKRKESGKWAWWDEEG
jgi:DNA-binding transcriptional MerR regulator